MRHITLQRITFPDPAICTENDLYVHLNEFAVLNSDLDLGEARIGFLPGGRAWFDTYMNLFSLGTWARVCDLPGLLLELRGQGRFHLRVWRQDRPDNAGQTLFEETVTLTPGGLRLDIGARLDLGPTAEGVILIRLTAVEAGEFLGGAWIAPHPEDGRDLRLAVAVTTFRREAEVTMTAARMAAFLDGAGGALLAEADCDLHLFLTDNGQSLSLPPDLAAHPRLTLIPNANLGGAGGFARGLAAAEDGDFSHCLFMDDDASFQMEALIRTAALLRLARDPATAVSGAMISAVRPWMMWENGAVFDRMCRPRHVGTDLRNGPAVTRMMLESARPNPPGFYGGWWFFAFPVDRVRHYPFPFFVRGDDISFSLAHDFRITTLNGVVSFQEDFSAKESPLTLYLDLRNHLHQHLVHDGMDIGPNGTAKIVAHFLLRSIIRMHYDSAEAQLEAWEDIMKGPAFFAGNADMSKRRPEIAALARTEAWRPIEGADLALPPLDEKAPEPSRLYGQILKVLLNGHLVPFWRIWGKRARIPVSHRGLIWPVWGKKDLVFTNADLTRAYRVRHDKPRAFGLMARSFRMYLRWRKEYPGLRDAHRQGYAEMAARPFWEERFLKSPAADGAGGSAGGHG